MKQGDRLIPTVESMFSKGMPVGTYTVGFDPMGGGFFLKQISDFTVDHKIYGNATERGERILKTFLSRPNATGVLLAKVIAKNASEVGISTLIINSDFSGDGFNAFIQSLDEPCVIIFDEFEKVYDTHEKQDGVLTLLDGVYPSKKLFILTSNDRYRVNTHMINRPGRIFYFIEYGGIDIKFVKEYCEDNLNNKEHIELLTRVVSLFENFNFDMLKAIVEEMNRYDEPPIKAMELLNTKPFSSNSLSVYDITITCNGVVIPKNMYIEDRVRGNPMARATNTICHQKNSTVPEEADYDEWDEENLIRFDLTPADILKIDAIEGEYQFKKVVGDAIYVVTFTREKVATYNWQSAF
jgi:hypothetical protein